MISSVPVYTGIYTSILNIIQVFVYNYVIVTVYKCSGAA